MQVLTVAIDAGEADTSQVHRFGHGQAFFQPFSHFDQVLVIEPLGPTDVLALGSGQLLSSLGLLWK